MSLVLQIVSGSRAGQRAEFTKSVVVAGRHPDSDLRFDAQKDLDVSTRHSEFRNAGAGWTVADLGSTNGTFVNGERISAPQAIRAGDAVSFGASGPRVDVIIAGEVSAGAVPRTEMRGSVGTARPKTEERIAVAVAAQTGSLKRFVVGLAVVVVIGIGVLVWMNQRSAAQARDQIATILQQSDSLRSALQHSVTEANSRSASFDSVARSLGQERDRLTRQLRSGGDVSALTNQIGALDRRTNQALSLTNRQISDANGKAVAYIAVEEHSKVHSFEGTAFCISAGGLLVTNKHVALDSLGRPPSRIAIVFADTDVPLAAHFVKASSDADLAFIQIDKPGDYPSIRGIASNTGLAAGDPIMVIGFPMGSQLAPQGAIRKTSLTAGFVSKLNPGEIQINAFSAEGSSGSPVFDSRGYVVGVLYAGQGGTSSSISFVVPGTALIANLPADARGIVKQ